MMDLALHAVEMALLLWLVLRRTPETLVRPRPVRPSSRKACDVCGAPASRVRTHFGAWRCGKHTREDAHGV